MLAMMNLKCLTVVLFLLLTIKFFNILLFDSCPLTIEQQPHHFSSLRSSTRWIKMSTLYDQVLKSNIYIQPVLLTLVVVTNSFSIRILSSNALRSSPCSHYFITYSVLSIIYSCLVCPTQVIRALWIGWENTPIGCNIYYYIIFSPPILARIMLVLASFDRYCSSSKSRSFNSASTKRIARLTVIISIVLGTIYMIPMFVIYYFDPTVGLCRLYTTLPANLYTFSQVIGYYMLGPLLILIFGTLTIFNIRKHSIRTGIQNGPTTSTRRTEGQLARMLILQIFVHIILTTPFGVIYCLNVLIAATRTPTTIAIRYIFLIWMQCDYFMSFFLHILSGKVYREQFCRLFKPLRKHPHPDQTIII
ncbi:unnamed protein product [Adineta ricciae]|uniref:G-protein coupled receptors family 1 profile domain-containing protein n=1 Tax=Adineta ricciae TaxID=249248 RepID=A0A816EZ71_ADIRI|nr:unnamed protein product [Adineta ricciae]